MSSEYVFPTKIFLMELKNKLQLTKFAKQILERKRDSLREALRSTMRSLIDVIIFLKRELIEILKFALATHVKYKEVIDAHALTSIRKAEIEVVEIAKGGIVVPKFRLKEVPVPKDGFPEGVRALVSRIIEGMHNILKLVELFVEFEMLLREIEITSRITNTLEKVIIPSLQEKIDYINMALSEIMISELSSLRAVISQLEGTKE